MTAPSPVYSDKMEEFINTVRMNECLWNMTCLKYRDNATKDSTWDTVAKLCDLANGREAKALWKRLRDSHREALRRRRNMRDKKVRRIKPWKYEHAMEFIREFMPTEESNPSDDSHLLVEVTPAEDYCYIDEEDSVQDDMPLAKKSISSAHERNSLPPSSPGPSSRKRRQMSQMAASSCDSIADLFSSLCKKTQGLPRALQLRVQREVFEAVARAEEEALSCRHAAAAAAGTAATAAAWDGTFTFKTSPVFIDQDDSPDDVTDD